MHKQDLVAEVAVRLDVSRRIATDAVDAVFAAITRAVAAGESVTVPGFGTFSRRLRAPRTARNPKTGARVAVPATSVAVFKPGAAFRQEVATRRR
jgi:DNA-binding protein HU-beta